MLPKCYRRARAPALPARGYAGRTERLHQWAIGAFAVAAAALFTALGTERWRAWVALGLAALFLLQRWFCFSRPGRHGPRLIFGEPSIDLRAFVWEHPPYTFGPVATGSVPAVSSRQV